MKHSPRYCNDPLCGEFTGEFPSQRPVTRGFDVYFDLWLSKRLSEQSRGWWFETPSRILKRHCNVHCSRGRDLISPVNQHSLIIQINFIYCLLNCLLELATTKTPQTHIPGSAPKSYEPEPGAEVLSIKILGINLMYQWNLHQDAPIFIPESTFESVIFERVTILSLPQNSKFGN